MNERGLLARALFRYLDLNGIGYSVLGDARAYPQAIASDVDIAVAPAAFARLPRLMAAFCRECDVYLVQMMRHERTAVYFVLAWMDDAGSPGFLAADFCSDYLRNGRRLLEAHELLEERVAAVDASGAPQEFRVPPPPVQFIYYLLKKVDKLELDDVHGEYLSACWREDPAAAEAQVRRFWPRPEDAGLVARAAANDEWFLVRGALRRLRAALHRSMPRSLPDLMGELGRRARRVLEPAGMTVAVLGPDGAGKSTVIAFALEELAPAFRRTCYLHLRPRLLSQRRERQPVTAPHALPARGRAASLLKLAYLLFDYIAGHLLRVWPMKCRSTLVVFDRHYRDLAVDAKRYRYGGPMRLVRWAANFVPGPDLWLVLDAPAEVLQARKSEVPAAESDRQRRAYLELAPHLPSAVVVDAARDVPQVRAQVETAIFRYLEGRLEYRHPELQIERNPLTARLLLYFCRHRTPLLAKVFRIIFNSDIHCRQFSPILMAHPYGIIIHAHSVIGRRVVIMQQVTLGGKDWGVNLAPVIEDDVYIGAGAKILGPVRVGRGAIVGANAVVTRDVPAWSTVVGANRVVKGHRPPPEAQSARGASEVVPFRERLRA